MSKVFVRDMTPDDAQAVLELWHESWLATYVCPELGVDRAWVEDQWRHRLTPEGIARFQSQINMKAHGARYFVAEADGVILGMAAPWDEPGRGQRVGALYVGPESVGTGVGHALMDAVLAALDPSRPVFLQVAAFNNCAIHFYERYGFEHIEGSDDVYLGVIPEFWMRRAAQDGRGVIRPASVDELLQISHIEHEADSAFASTELGFIAQGQAPDPSNYCDAQADGRLLVYEISGHLAGFIRLELVDGEPHIEQVSVGPKFARQGVGRDLMKAAENWAIERGFMRITLTTYRDVPWNMPYYERLGWRELAEATCGPELQALRQHERDLGLDVLPRVAMVKCL